jgi:hypothetical protein
MASSGIFECFKYARSVKKIDLLSDSIVVGLMVQNYEPNFDSDVYYSDIPEDLLLSETLLLGKYIDSNIFKASQPIFESISIGNIVQGIVLYRDSDYIEDTLLIAYFNFLEAVVTQGEDITILWNEQGIITL